MSRAGATHIDAIALAIEGLRSRRWRWFARTPRSIRETRSRCPSRSACLALLGFSGRRDHHEAQLALLEELAPHWDDDWWFLGYLGWAYIENRGGGARDPAGRAIRSAGNPRNAHAAHQRVHGFFEAGDAAGGAAFIEDWLKGTTGPGYLHCHLSWHQALFELAAAIANAARAIYIDNIRPSAAQAVPMLVLADFGIVSVALAVLWRGPIARARMGRSHRPRPATFSARQPRFCRSSCGAGRSCYR